MSDDEHASGGKADIPDPLANFPASINHQLVFADVC
jgi:hypothetical protein